MMQKMHTEQRAQITLTNHYYKNSIFLKECLNNATKPETMGSISQVAQSAEVKRLQKLFCKQ